MFELRSEPAFHLDAQLGPVHEIGELAAGRRRLLGGLDDIALTLQEGAAIAAFEAARERPGPVTTAL